MQLKRVRRVALAALLACVHGIAGASSFTVQGDDVQRVDAALIDGLATWRVDGDRLLRALHTGGSASSAPVHESGATTPLLTSDNDFGAWVAKGELVTHYDAAVRAIGTVSVGAPAQRLVAAGPDALWVATRDAVTRIDRGLHVIERHALDPQVDDDVLALELDALAGALWVVTSREAIRLDAFDGLRELSRVPVPGAGTATLDPATGELWVVGERDVRVLDRHGVTLLDGPVAGPGFARPGSVLVDSAAVFVGDALGVSALDPASGVWRRVTDDPHATLIATARSFAPAIDVVLDPSTSALHLRVHAVCAPRACAPDVRYAATTRLRVTLGDLDVSSRLRPGEADSFVVPLEIAEVRDDVVVRVDASDAYGNAAPTRHAELRALHALARVKANLPPTVTITAPANNAVAVAPAAFTIAASASDPDGSVTKVEFYRSGVLLGTDATVPYIWTWANVPVGTYSLMAKAYDNAGATTVSAPVSVQVRANVAPSVTLSSPPNNSNFVAPATITLSATASDSDGTIAKVDFLRGGSTPIGTATSAPYTYTWANVPAGTYSLTARATDDKGATTTSTAVTAKVNNPPNVSVTAPANNASFVAPATVTIQASASDSDGTVAKVEFFQNGALLATDTTAPYSYAWANPPLGNYSLTAKATDNLGATRVSAPVAISVKANQPPTVTLTSPTANLQRVAGTSLALAASASDPDGSIAKVDFRLGGAVVATDTTAPYAGTITVPLGSFPLTAVATDNKGAQATSAAVTLTGVANQLPTVTLDAPLDGQAFPAPNPPDITLRATASDADGTVTRVRFMVVTMFNDLSQGAPTAVGTATQPPYTGVWHAVPFTDRSGSADASVPWGYQIWAEADDDAGGTAFSTEVAVISVPNGSPWSIAITQPANGAELALPATAVIVATPSTATGGNAIRQVELLADGASLATLTSANGAGGEYAYAWRNVPAGTHSVVARLTDGAGFVVQSDATMLSMRPSDQLPTVTLTSPALVVDRVVGGTAATLSLSANAADTGGNVAAVEFFGDGVLVATTLAPFAGTWANVPAGIHTVRARARDDRGREAQSRPSFVDLRVVERAPVVTLTAPTPGATYHSGSPVTLEADAVAPDGAITRVDFVYMPNNVVIGSATVPPYRYSWIPPPGNGTYTIRANVTTFAHSSAASTPVTVNVSSNNPPVVTLTAPRDGQPFAGGIPIALSATASDTDGTIAKVEFLASGIVVATVTGAPYNATWTPAAGGNYSIAARATDNAGASTLSGAAAITVLPAAASVAITSPAANAVALASEPLTVTAQGVLPGRTLARIDFLVDGAAIGNVTFTGATSAGVATYSWAMPSAGAHTLSARVVATDGTSLVSAGVAVRISDFAVALAEPFAGQSFLAPGDIRIFASPTSSASTIARVEFLGDGVLLFTAASPPYLYVWRGMGAGTHTVTARAVDSAGLVVGASTTVQVVASPSLTIDAGIDGSSIADDAGTITGTIVAPRNVAVIINGQPASVDLQGRFFLENLLLQPGVNKVVLWLNTHDAPPVSQTITVNSTGSAPFAVDLSPQQGFAPLAATLTIRNRTTTTYQRVEIDTNDDGTPEQTLVSAAGGELRIDYTLPTPGLYRMRVTVYDASNRIVYQARRQARVYDRAELAGHVIDTYWSMVDRLAANDTSAALRLFTADAQDRYADVFATLGSGVVAVAPQLRRIVDGVIGEDIAELTHARDTPNGPQVFMIYLVRGRDGLWRIETM
jgi:hypothetical protein